MKRLEWGLPIILLLGFLGLFLFNKAETRTFILSAETRGVSVVFEGRNAWFLGPATLCLPRPSPMRAGGDSPDAACETRIYEERHDPALTIEWQSGSAITLRHEGARVVIVIDTGSGGLPDGTIVSIDGADLAQQGALKLSGTMRIGEAMAPGVRGFLVGGTYRIRERSILSTWFDRRSDEVKSGELTRGDHVSVVLRRAPPVLAPGFGQITVAGPDSLHAVFQSAAPDAAILVEALGVQGALIEPDWIDTLLASPYLLVIGGVLGVIANMISLSYQMLDRFRSAHAGRGRPSPPPAAVPEPAPPPPDPEA